MEKQAVDNTSDSAEDIKEKERSAEGERNKKMLAAIPKSAKMLA